MTHSRPSTSKKITGSQIVVLLCAAIFAAFLVPMAAQQIMGSSKKTVKNTSVSAVSPAAVTETDSTKMAVKPGKNPVSPTVLRDIPTVPQTVQLAAATIEAPVQADQSESSTQSVSSEPTEPAVQPAPVATVSTPEPVPTPAKEDVKEEVKAVTPTPAPVAATPPTPPIGNTTPTSTEPRSPESSPSSNSQGNPSGPRPGRESLTPPRVAVDGKTVRLNFRAQPWRTVLQWLAEQAKLSIELENAPMGSLTYVDEKYYTPAEAIDVVNGFLVLRGYILVKKDSMLLLFDTTKTGIPPEFVQTISPTELDKYGTYELVRVVFPLVRTTPDVVESEVQKMIRPFGTVITFAKSQSIQVTEMAGQLRAIRDIIQRIDNPEGSGSATLVSLELENISADEAVGIMRELIAIDKSDSSLRTVVDATGKKVILSGRPDMITLAKDTLLAIDRSFVSPKPEGEVTFKSYMVDTADPNVVLAALQTRLAGRPDVRLQLDTYTGTIISQGRQADHDIIVATIQEMGTNATRVELIQLNKLDPIRAVAAIRTFFEVSGSSTSSSSSSFGGGSSGGRPSSSTTSRVPPPVVEADTALRQIYVKANSLQISQIKSLLANMGEDFKIPQSGGGEGNRIRTIPLSPAAQKLVVEWLQQAWPEMGDSELKVVTPSGIIAATKSPQPIPQRILLPQQQREVTGTKDEGRAPDVSRGVLVEPRTESPKTVPDTKLDTILDDEIDELIDETFRKEPVQTTFFVPVKYQRAVMVDDDDELVPIVIPPRGTGGTSSQSAAPQLNVGVPIPDETAMPVRRPIAAGTDGLGVVGNTGNGKPPVVVSIGPDGLMIASEDAEALDRLEELVKYLSDSSTIGKTRTVVYYITNTSAETIGSTLQSLMGSSSYSYSSTTSGSSSGSSMMSNSPMAAVHDYLSDGGNIKATGTVTVVTDTRLNALFIDANELDHRTISRLLPILDQLRSPQDPQNRAKPRLIQLEHMTADEARTRVQTIFADKMGTSSQSRNGQQQQQQGIPPQMMQMIQQAMQGGGGGRSPAGRTNQPQEEVQKMTLDVDANTNSLIVSAPEALYLEVRDFVMALDAAAGKTETVTQVIQAKDLGTQAMQTAIQALAPANIQVNTRGSSSGRTGGFGGTTGGFNTGGGGFNTGGTGGTGGFNTGNTGGFNRGGTTGTTGGGFTSGNTGGFGGYGGMSNMGGGFNASLMPSPMGGFNRGGMGGTTGGGFSGGGFTPGSGGFSGRTGGR